MCFTVQRHSMPGDCGCFGSRSESAQVPTASVRLPHGSGAVCPGCPLQTLLRAMAVTPDMLQGLMQQVMGPMVQMMERMLVTQQQSVQQIQTQQAALMSETGRSFAEVVNKVSASTRGGLIDNRGVGKPDVFKGEEGRFREWKAKFVGYVVSGN